MTDIQFQRLKILIVTSIAYEGLALFTLLYNSVDAIISTIILLLPIAIFPTINHLWNRKTMPGAWR